MVEAWRCIGGSCSDSRATEYLVVSEIHWFSYFSCMPLQYPWLGLFVASEGCGALDELGGIKRLLCVARLLAT